MIWGERDQIIPVEHGYAVRAARPGSRLEVLAGLGHFPHVESPTEVASAIEEFIAASQDAADTTQLSSQSRGPHRNLEVSEDSKSELRRLFDDLKSRKQIEVAVGVLMGLRGYSSDEAVKDFVDAVHETGVSPGDLGRALIDLARGQEPSVAKGRGPATMGAPASAAGPHCRPARDTTVRVRYGAREPVNALLSDQTPRCALAKDRG